MRRIAACCMLLAFIVLPGVAAADPTENVHSLATARQLGELLEKAPQNRRPDFLMCWPQVDKKLQQRLPDLWVLRAG